MKRTLLLLFCYLALLLEPARAPAANINVVWTSEVGQFAPLWMTKEAKLFEKYSNHVQLIFIQGASAAAAALSSDDAQVGMFSPQVVISTPALDLVTHWQAGLRPQASAYTAATYAVAGLQAFFGGLAVVMAAFTVARSIAGRLRPTRRAALDATRAMLLYAVAQGLIALALLHAFTRLTG